MTRFFRRFEAIIVGVYGVIGAIFPIYVLFMQQSGKKITI